jgi:hypothetical protein
MLWYIKAEMIFTVNSTAYNVAYTKLQILTGKN